MKIKIIKTPIGPAPKPYREKSVGMTMEAERKPVETIIGETTEKDFISGDQTSRSGFIVRAETFLALLAQKSPKAAQWFKEHTPADIFWFSFGDGEAVIVP